MTISELAERIVDTLNSARMPNVFPEQREKYADDVRWILDHQNEYSRTLGYAGAFRYAEILFMERLLTQELKEREK